MKIDVPLSAICSNTKISQLLKKYNIRIKYNKWSVTQVNTKGIGTLFLVNPRAISENEMLVLLQSAASDQKAELF